ncbi:hypothetical protein VKT23_002725 [Stygiomarasmius scandens]|uniref:Uncharacterized protein n=1 Tax=Marasmiellus scandens TaxID=2682957 RepID=A0ABR1K8W1_9AGAR
MREVRSLVKHMLGQDTQHWWMLNNCPCCQYEVVDEPKLEIRMMLGIDRNNSLKRGERQGPAGLDGGLGELKERADPWIGGDDFFLKEEEVDKWDEKNWHTWEGWTPPTSKTKKAPCEKSFRNMDENKTKKEVGHWRVTGTFWGFCRHSFVLKLMDMIRSGEGGDNERAEQERDELKRDELKRDELKRVD